MAGEIYRVLGTPVVWGNAIGGSIDEELDLGGADGDAGDVCVGSYHDWGSGAQPDGFILVVNIDGFTSAPTIGAVVATYIAESDDATVWSGPEAPADTADSTGSVNRLPNLLGPFPAVVRSTTAGDNVTRRFEYQSTARYSAPVVHNATAVELLASGDAHTVTITPFWYQVQS